VKIACPHCRAAFALDDKRVPAAGLSIKCPKCKQPFAVHRARPEDEGKIIDGRPLAVPLPGAARKPAAGTSSSPPPAPSPRASSDDEDESTSIDQAPLGERPYDAVPLPGAANDSYGAAPRARSAQGAAVPPPPPPPSAPPPAQDYASEEAVPLPGANDEERAFRGQSSQPGQQGAPEQRASDDAVPLPGADGEEPEQRASDDAVPLPGANGDDSERQATFAAIEAASGWKGVEFAPSPPDLPEPRSVAPVDDPFANIDIEVPDEPRRGFASQAPQAPAPQMSAPVMAPPQSVAPSDDPFGLDFPSAPVPPAPAPPATDSMDYEFVDPASALTPVKPNPGMLDFVEEGKAAPKAAPKPGRPPPMIAPGATAASTDRAGTLAADDAAIAQMSADAAGPKKKAKKEKKEKKPKAPREPREPREPIGPRLKAAIGPALEKLNELKKKPSAIAGGVGILVLLVVIALGIHASMTSAGLFWKNLWTSSGKQHNAAARDALLHGEQKLADGGFGAAREAMAISASTLKALPDDEEARTFFVLCAAELKIGWGATGGDWDQATHIVEKLKGKHLDIDRAVGAFALASGDLGQAKLILAPLGDAPNADTESVWLYSQALLRGGEAPHAAQVLEGSLHSNPSVKLLLLLGQVQTIRGKPDEAAKQFEAALLKAPNSGRALVEVADVKLKAGDLAAAGSLLDRVLAPEVHAQLDATEDGHASLLRARLADQQHNGKEAEAQFERAAKLDSNASQTFAAYGVFRLKRREFDKAAKQFDLALALDAKNPETLGNSARAYLRTNRYLDADKRIREALDKDPNNPRLIYVSGKVAEVIGKLEEATKEYSRALLKKADLPEALIAQAGLAINQGDKVRAKERTLAAEKAPAADKSAIDYEGLTELWLALGDPAQAKGDASLAQEEEPEDPYADFAMGEALSALGDLAAARALFEKSLARVDGDPQMHFELGSLLRRQGNADAARKELEKAVQLDNKESRFHARLGALMVEQGEFVAADAQLRQSVLMDERNIEAFYFLGRALIAERQLPEAINTLKKALEIDPNDARVHYQLGLAYEAGGQLVPAGESYAKSTEKDPKDPEAWEHLGNAEAAQNVFPEALIAFKKVVAINPNHARAWAEMGEVEFQLNELDKAITDLSTSVKLDPAQAPVWARLGAAFRDRGCDNCKTRAIGALQKATQLAPKEPTAFRDLGYIYKDDRKRADAVASFKRYLELKPEAADADTIKDDIFYLQEEGKRAP
jgi:predicted Zn finger-like uncharacterized protein